MDYEKLYDDLPEEKKKEFEQKGYAKEDCVKCIEAVGRMIENIVPVIKRMTKLALDIAKGIIKAYPNRRVVHLALYGKGRTKKKNMNRIKRDMFKGRD